MNRRWRGRIGLGSGILCAAGLVGSSAASAADFHLTPSLTLGESYNDNINLAPGSQAEGGFITTVTPGFLLTDNSERLKLNLNYAPQAVFFLGSKSSQSLQQQLIGNGELTLLPDQLFLDADASISKAFVSGNGPVGATTLTTNSNLQTVQTYDIGPRLLHHFGEFADSLTRDTYSAGFTGGSGVAPTHTNEFLQRLTSGEDFGRLGWTLTADQLRSNSSLSAANFSGTTGSTSNSFKDEYVSGQGRYAVVQGFALTSTIGYEHVAGSSVASIPSYEIFYNGGFDWHPSLNTLLDVAYGHRYGGPNLSVNGRWDPAPDMRFTLTYGESVQNSSSLLASNLGQLGLSPSGVFINTFTRQAFSPSGVLTGVGGATPLGITNSAFLLKQWQSTAVVTRERNTYTASLYYSTETATNPASREEVYGGSLIYTRQLSPVMSGSLSGAYNISDVSGEAGFSSLSQFGNGRTNFYAVAANLTYQLSATASTQFTLTRTESQNAGTGTIPNDIVTVLFTKKF